MMQVITIVENTDSSWIVPAESDNYLNSDGSVSLRLAQDFQKYSLIPSAANGSIQRIQAGDLTHDFSQDIAISRTGIDGEGGVVELYDGASLLNNTTQQLSTLSPYAKSTIAPWAFIEDFTGDGKRDLVTAGFKGDKINLSDLQITAWTSKKNGKEWSQAFEFNPFDHIETDLHTDGGHRWFDRFTVQQVKGEFLGTFPSAQFRTRRIGQVGRGHGLSRVSEVEQIRHVHPLLGLLGVVRRVQVRSRDTAEIPGIHASQFIQIQSKLLGCVEEIVGGRSIAIAGFTVLAADALGNHQLVTNG